MCLGCSTSIRTGIQRIRKRKMIRLFVFLSFLTPSFLKNQLLDKGNWPKKFLSCKHVRVSPWINQSVNQLIQNILGGELMRYPEQLYPCIVYWFIETTEVTTQFTKHNLPMYSARCRILYRGIGQHMEHARRRVRAMSSTPATTQSLTRAAPSRAVRSRSLRST